MKRFITMIMVCITVLMAGCAKNEDADANNASVNPKMNSESPAGDSPASDPGITPTEASSESSSEINEQIRWTIDDSTTKFNVDMNLDGTPETISISPPADFGDYINVTIEMNNEKFELNDRFVYDNSPALYFYDLNADGLIEIIFNDGYRAGDFVDVVTFTGTDFADVNAEIDGRIQEIKGNRIITDTSTNTFSSTLRLISSDPASISPKSDEEGSTSDEVSVTLSFPESDLKNLLNDPRITSITEVVITNTVEFNLTGLSSMPNLKSLYVEDINVASHLPEILDSNKLKTITIGNSSNEGDVEYFLRNEGLSNGVDFIYSDGSKNLFQSEK